MKRFEAFARHHTALLVSSLERYDPQDDEKTLHEIRTSIKRIKTVLKVIGSSNKKFDAHKHYLPYRTIFRQAGEIRSRDIMLHLLRDYGVTSDELTASISKTRQTFAATLHTHLPDFVSLARVDSIHVCRSAAAVTRDDITRYTARKRKAIKRALTPRHDVHRIHTIRKSIKEVLYLMEVTKEGGKKELKFYRTLEQQIGEFHDKLLLADLIRSTASDSEMETIALACNKAKKNIRKSIREYY